jgi:hypothetical protein
MTAIEYYPRVQSHRSSRSGPVGSSDPRVEGNLDQNQEITSDDVSVDCHSIYVLSDPPATLTPLLLSLLPRHFPTPAHHIPPPPHFLRCQGQCLRTRVRIVARVPFLVAV